MRLLLNDTEYTLIIVSLLEKESCECITIIYIMENETREPRIYEVSFLLLPTIGDAGIADSVSRIKSLFAELGGAIITEGETELIDLAYPMLMTIENKQVTFTNAYFGWVKFTLSPEKALALQTAMDSNTDCIRYLFITTVREDTMPKKRISRRQNSQDNDAKTPASGLIEKESLEDIHVDIGEEINKDVKEEKVAEEVNEEELDAKLDTLTV